LICLVN